MANLDQNTQIGASATSPNTGVKKGLPATGLPAAEDAVTKLWGVARLGAVSPETFARQFGAKAKASGGVWTTRLAVLRGFKLLRFEGTQIGVSPLGQQMVNSSNPAGQLAARRTAVMNLKAYKELVEAFNGTVLPGTDQLATRLQFDYGKTPEFAKSAAEAFVASLQHAEMLDPTNVVRKEGVASQSPVSPSEPAGPAAATNVQEEDAEAAEIDAAFEQEEDEEEPQRPGDGLPARAMVSPNFSLAVTLDLSNFTADDVIRILESMGFNIRG